MLTDRFDEGLMVLRNLFGWHLIDMSYLHLRSTSSTMKAFKESGKGTGDVEDHPPTYDELSIQVSCIPHIHACIIFIALCAVCSYVKKSSRR